MAALPRGPGDEATWHDLAELKQRRLENEDCPDSTKTKLYCRRCRIDMDAEFFEKLADAFVAGARIALIEALEEDDR